MCPGGTSGWWPFDWCEDSPVCSGEPTDIVESGPGRAYATFSKRPTDEELDVFGGAVGCVGTCVGWSSLFDGGYLSGGALFSYNAPTGLTLDLSTLVPSVTSEFDLNLVGSDYEIQEWEGSGSNVNSSIGFQSVSGTRYGRNWDVSNRSWSSSGVGTALHGGTVFQNLASDASWQECYDDSDGLNACDGGFHPRFRFDDWEADGPSDGVYRFSTSGPQYFPVSPDSALSRYDAVAMEGPGDLVAFVGGRSGIGASAPSSGHLVDYSTSDSLNFSLPRGVAGGAAVYDPVSRRGFVFSGGGKSVLKLDFPQSLVANEGGEFEVSDYKAYMEWDSVNSEWLMGADYTLEWSCSVAGCYASEISMALPYSSEARKTSWDVEVEYIDFGSLIENVSTDVNSEFAVLEYCADHSC